MSFDFSWDERKAAANLRKHRISFAEASTIFDDPLAITYPDGEHSNGETRYPTFGLSASGKVLLVSHIETNEGIRIIRAPALANPADRAERKIYEQG
jgi:uncharacterized protein